MAARLAPREVHEVADVAPPRRRRCPRPACSQAKAAAAATPRRRTARLAGRNFVPLLRALPTLAASLSTTTAANPLLPGASIPPPEAPPPDALEAGGPPEYLAGERTRLHAVAHFRNLPVSLKKLRLVANLMRGLYVREAMAQMEFCRKNIAVMVKNCIDNACANARWGHGLDVKRLKVSYVSVGKGLYVEGTHQSKGRAGIKNSYFSHLRIEVTEVSQKEIEATKGYGRWRRGGAVAFAIPVGGARQRAAAVRAAGRLRAGRAAAAQVAPPEGGPRDSGPAARVPWVPDRQASAERLGRAHDYYHNREP